MEKIKFDHTIIKHISGDPFRNVIGYIIELSNGDQQYLTIEEYRTFTKDRNNDKETKVANIF